MEPPKQNTNTGNDGAAVSTPILTASQSEIDMLQDRVRELDRLASIGQLTAGILHEIKNPLNFINNYAQISVELAEEAERIVNGLPESPNPDEKDELTMLVGRLHSNVSRIEENGARAQRIIQGMLAQVRVDEIHFEATNLNTLVEEFSKLAYQGVRAGDTDFNLSFVFRLDPEVGMVHIAPYEFNRVILNLVLNACYALNERRKREGKAYKPTLTISTARQSDSVSVTIRDNGDGIPEEVKAKLFTPFFTTKPVGKGTGLGLTLSRDIIRQIHHGDLTLETVPGEYTEFVIQLPCQPK
ncbi:sensor histidine kinase [Arsenicibacter rosenii]|uniref:histidine kinase n=1 Tax=Arsenicibacter rosenii TaxID=1750698 RepID=A0A1S2VR53_9BACT|nr:ATP-binding protein [Arsenicibacter rosenii]OIN60646.1 hypothetical protein BLX24_00580 [Arsenicibacter rosenii]